MEREKKLQSKQNYFSLANTSDIMFPCFPRSQDLKTKSDLNRIILFHFLDLAYLHL
jgi:hypothetical protein